MSQITDLSVSEIKDTIHGIVNKYNIDSLNQKLNEFKSIDYKVKVAFLGEFSAGKSTLVNALMKKNFLPTFDKPTTAIITEIQKGNEYKFEISEKIGDEEKIIEISPSDLADEVQKSGGDRILKISVPDSELIGDDLIIIDTPGVSSINESHSDVTYGYIPMVDVAFLVVNVNMGSISKSLKEFINQYPEEIKNKIYFVLNFSDTKAPSERKKLIEEFTQSVGTIIDSPRIFEVSALNAIKANNSENQELYEKSGVNQIEKVIVEEIPQLKGEIKQHREKEFLLEIRASLINVLEEMRDNIDQDDEGLYDRIKILRNEIEHLEKAEKSFFNTIKNLEEKAISDASEIADQYVQGIIEKFIQKEPYAENIADMFQEIQINLINNLPDFENFDTLLIDDAEVAKTISDISSKIASKFQAGQEYSKLAMSGLLAVVFPASGAWNIAEFGISHMIQSYGNQSAGAIENNGKEGIKPTAVLPAMAWKDLSGKQKALRIGGGLLKASAIIIEKTNAFEKLANTINKNTETNKLRRELRSKATLIVTKTFSNIKIKANQYVNEQFKIPLNSKIEGLEDLRENRKMKIIDNEKKSESLNKDLYQLKSI